MSVGGPVTAIIAGSIGGAIGAAIWGGIAYATHYEVGYVAWGIGGLVGVCVRVVAGDMDDFYAGVTAGVLSVISILAGKILSAILIVNFVMQQGNLAGDVDLKEVYWTAVGICFTGSFGVLDIAFFLLAVFTAYKLGSGGEDD